MYTRMMTLLLLGALLPLGALVISTARIHDVSAPGAGVNDKVVTASEPSAEPLVAR